MTERRTIGRILTDVGRITDEDVGRALAHQRDHGGYFGEALLACGLVSQEELDWGLASQFDLPYVFPDADSVDPEAASLVSPEWALANLTLPIMRTETTLTVIVDSPLKTDSVEELRRRTELEVDLALAGPAVIRDLVRQVYARAAAAEAAEEHRTPVELHEALDAVMLADAPRYGVSVRGARAYAWWDERGMIRRRPLAGDWRASLEKILIPGVAEMVGERHRASWDGELNRTAGVMPVHIHFMADESGREYLFKPRTVGATLQERFPPPADGIVTEVQLLARSGTARFIVVTDPADLGHELLPHLPSLLLDPAWRSIYVHADQQRGEDEAFSLRMPADPATWADEIEALQAFHFDVVTVDLSGGDRTWASRALDIASVAFLLWPAGEDTRPASKAGIRWQLGIERQTDGGLVWSLGPLNG
jgi:hypothetical protein